jgi:eukaryotic-like serine/threonine-protein kinase
VLVTGLLSGTADESEPRIVQVRDKAERLLSQAQLGRDEQTTTEAARAQFRRFLDLRDEALFLDTTRFADGLGNSPEATCRAARDGLRVFGQSGTADEWALSPLPPALSSQERDDVRSGFYQLLLVLADAVSQSPGAKPAQRAEEAMRIVNRAEGLHSPATRAFHLRRADFLGMKGDREGEAQERNEAGRLAPADAFDLFLMGRESSRRSDWPEAISQLSAATQRQPDHFWAQCLLAICHLQTHQPVKARIGLNACLQRKPDRAWLYILRGFANAEAAREEASRHGPAEVKGASEQFAAAEADYRTAIELLGTKTEHAELHYVVLLNRGMMWLLRDDFLAAAADFEEASRLNDRRFEAFAALGQVFQRQGRTNDALIQCSKAIKLRPIWSPLYRVRAHVYLGVKDLSPELGEMSLSELEAAISSASTGRRDAASQDLAAAIRNESPGEQLIAADWTKKAAILHVAQRHAEALDACNAAINIADRYPRAHELRIRVLLDLKKYDDLIQSCDIVLAWAKPSAKLYELRGIAKNAIADYSGAIGDFTRSLDLSAAVDKPRLFRARGRSNLANEAFRPAIQDFDEAIRLAPTNADAYLGRGTAKARLCLYRDADSDAQNAQKYGDPSPRFNFLIARIYSLAAAAVRLESRRDRQNSDRLQSRYEDLALKFVRLAIERTPAVERLAFLRETIKSDPAMKPIQRPLELMESRLIDQAAPR